jgi:uncharacterized protein (DUF3820 family)
VELQLKHNNEGNVMSSGDERDSASELEKSAFEWKVVPSISEQEYQHSVPCRRIWRPMPFGKYKDRTLPQVLFEEPDYLFWLLRKEFLKGALAMQAKELAKKAYRIRIPREPTEAFVVDYFFNSEGQFSCFSIVPKDAYQSPRVVYRLKHIDFSIIQKHKEYAKGQYKKFLKAFRRVFFGDKSARMTKNRCEAFFSGDNFLSKDEYQESMAAGWSGL